MEQGQRRRVPLVLRFDFQDHFVLVRRSIDGRNLARAEGAVERVFDLLRGHSDRQGLLPVDIHHDLGTGDLQVGVHVLQFSQAGQFFFEYTRPLVEFLRIRPLERILVETSALLPPDVDGGRDLQEHPDARDDGELGPQGFDDLLRASIAFGASFEPPEDDPAVSRHGKPARPPPTT